jgi:hypothetical protein
MIVWNFKDFRNDTLLKVTRTRKRQRLNEKMPRACSSVVGKGQAWELNSRFEVRFDILIRQTSRERDAQSPAYFEGRKGPKRWTAAVKQ